MADVAWCRATNRVRRDETLIDAYQPLRHRRPTKVLGDERCAQHHCHYRQERCHASVEARGKSVEGHIEFPVVGMRKAIKYSPRERMTFPTTPRNCNAMRLNVLNRLCDSAYRATPDSLFS